mgnify:CR=1 FL=1
MVSGMRSVEIRRSSPGLGTEMVVLDGLCPELRSLLPHARLNPLLIGSAPDPIDVVGEAVAAEPVETLHVVAHGRRGGFQLGGQWIDRQALIDHAATLARWGVQRVALWSCSLGQDHDFIALLAELTGAEVWSSDRPLGEGQIWRLTLSASSPVRSLDGTRLDEGMHEPRPPFLDAALSVWPYQLNQKCPDPFNTELAGILISNPLQIKGTKVQQNEITLATTQPAPEPGTMFFRQTESAGNNLIGSIYYVEDGREVQVEGELSRQVKSVDGSPQSVEGYYFVAKSLDVAYLLVTFTGDGGKENLSFFSPGGTYKTSSDFKCQSFFSPPVIAQIEDPGDPEPERFELPPDSSEPPIGGGGDAPGGSDNPGDEGGTPAGGGNPGDEGGSPGGGDTIEQLITVVDPEGNVLPDDAYTIQEDPNDNTITVDLNDADPDRPGDQTFDDGTYTVLFREEELGGIVVQSDVLQEVFGGPCVEALVAERSRRSSRKSGGKGESITGSRSNRLQALPGSGDMDVITGTSGPDVYRLGDQSGAFRALHGNRDYVRIAEFGPDDRLVLHGDSADYSQSGPLTLGGHSGYALSFRGDLIALIQGAQAGGAADFSGLSAAQISYI